MKTKILIVGIGGVGGYYGGLLSRKYENSTEIAISFLSRGAHLEAIRQKGLTVIAENETFVTHPALATDRTEEIGVVDYIILATKSYDLIATIEQIKPCIGAQTVILPLLNGADISQRIAQQLPHNEIWQGCVYIVGRLNEPGVVESSGGVHDLFFGKENHRSDKLLFMEKTMKEAGIKAFLSQDINQIVWKKFIFISTTASLTSYFNVGFRELLDDEESKNFTMNILTEIVKVAQAEGVHFDYNIIDTTIKHIERLPYGKTSSMHSDFIAGKNTELQILTRLVLDLGKKHQLELPAYQAIYKALSEKLK